MGRLGTFVPRLLALTGVWLLATTALTYAAAQRMNTATPTPAAATTTAAAASRVLVVPDVRNQAYVFAKGTLGDSGFAWRVVGGVQGYPANTVVSQSPAAGTRVIDTGAPLIALHLSRAPGAQNGLPETASAIAGTAVRMADAAVARAKVAHKALAKAPAHVVAPAHVAPAHRAPAKKTPPQQKRPPAFVVAGARREPLDEIPLSARARALLKWIDHRPKATDANVKYWLYQHAWIVTGAELGWWQGRTALETLSAVDKRVWELWGIGAASKAQAEAALSLVRSKEAK